MDISIIPAHQIDDHTLHQILELYDLAYGEKAAYSPFIRMLAKERDPTPWIWKNTLPIHGLDAHIALAHEDEDLTGYTSYLYKNALLHGSLERVAQSNDAMVHPAHQRKGIFKTLVNALNETAQAHGAVAVYSFPNALNPRLRDTNGFANESLGNVPYMACEHPHDEGIESTAGIPPDLGARWLEMTEEFSFGISKNTENMRWRYLDNPHNRDTYTPIHIPGAFAMLKEYRDATASKGHIVELISADPESTEMIVRAAHTRFARAGLHESSIFMFPHTHHHDILTRAGYSPRPWQTHIAYGSFTRTAPPSTPYIMMGDSDTF